MIYDRKYENVKKFQEGGNINDKSSIVKDKKADIDLFIHQQKANLELDKIGSEKDNIGRKKYISELEDENKVNDINNKEYQNKLKSFSDDYGDTIYIKKNSYDPLAEDFVIKYQRKNNGKYIRIGFKPYSKEVDSLVVSEEEALPFIN